MNHIIWSSNFRNVRWWYCEFILGNFMGEFVGWTIVGLERTIYFGALVFKGWYNVSHPWNYIHGLKLSWSILLNFIHMGNILCLMNSIHKTIWLIIFLLLICFTDVAMIPLSNSWRFIQICKVRLVVFSKSLSRRKGWYKSSCGGQSTTSTWSPFLSILQKKNWQPNYTP